jgi:hypothetical protein
MLGKSPHDSGALVEIGPALEILDRNVEFLTHGFEQIPEVELFDRHLDVEFLLVPKTDRRISLMYAISDVVDPTGGLALGVRVVEQLETDDLAGFILSANVERQRAGLPTIGDELLRRAEIALAEPVAFQDVAPAPRADGEIHC